MKTSSTEDFADNKIIEDFEKIIILKVWDDMQNKNYQEALNTLDEFYKSHANQDNKDMLLSTCNPWKASIFEEQGLYSQALALYQEIFQTNALEDWMSRITQINIARVLLEMERDEEVIEEIEKILAKNPESPFDLLLALEIYIPALQNLQKDLPSQVKSLVEFVSENIGIEIAKESLVSLDDFSQAVEKLSHHNHEANRRYRELIIELHKAKNSDLDDSSYFEFEKSLLQEYISEETVGYYRNLATERLDEVDFVEE